MRRLNVTFVEKTGFRVEDYPNAETIVTLEHPEARRFTDLALHRCDLDFAVECLEAIEKVAEEPWVLREGLWRSAVIHVLKCFDASASRLPLVPGSVYGSEAPAIQAYEYFRALRNKHLVHDENAWMRCLAGVVLNKRGHPQKVADVTLLTLRACTLDQGSFGNLWLLATKARDWVVAELDRLHEVILRDCERADYEELLLKPPVNWQAPSASDVSRKK